MEFCQNCGCRLEPRKVDEQVVLACSKCDYTKQVSGNRSQAKVVKVISPSTQPFMTVVTAEESKISTMSTIKMKCEKCPNTECFVWQVQTRGGDEASTQFLRCTKCGHTFREYT
jgi:DNA-directed RNA polymerase subunit M